MCNVVSGFFVFLSYASEENSAAEFQKHLPGGTRAVPRHQLPGGRQRRGQNQRRGRRLLPLDVQVVAADDRRAEHPPRRRLLPRRRDLCERCRQAGNHRVQLLAQGRQGAQAQRQGVRTAFGPRGTDSRGDRVAGRQRADLGRRRRAPTLSQRLHFTAGPRLSRFGDALQRRAGRTQPPAENPARRNHAPNLRHAAVRTRQGHPRPAAGVRRAAATRDRGLLQHPLGRPGAGRTALQIGAERPSVRGDTARCAAEGHRQRIHDGRHSPRRPGAENRRLSPAQIRIAGTAEILPDRPQTGAVRRRRPDEGRTPDPAAGRPLRQARRRAQERAAAEDPAEGPAGNAAENAANTPENASENATEDSAKGAEKERSVQPESTDEQP